jgi:hypothetical protein
MDSNHHGEISPQGPQPHTPAPATSAGVRNVQIARVRGHIERIWSSECCHDVATPTLLIGARWRWVRAPVPHLEVLAIAGPPRLRIMIADRTIAGLAVVGLCQVALILGGRDPWWMQSPWDRSQEPVDRTDRVV